MGRESGPSPEDMGLKPEETRILSDAELIKGGARIKEGGRLEVTKEQVGGAHREMNDALFAKNLKLARETADQARQQGESADQELTRDREFGRFYEKLQDQLRRLDTGTSGRAREITMSGGSGWHSDEVSYDDVEKFVESYGKFFGEDAAVLEVALTEIKRKHEEKEDIGAWATSRESNIIHGVLQKTFYTFRDIINKRKAAT